MNQLPVFTTDFPPLWLCAELPAKTQRKKPGRPSGIDTRFISMFVTETLSNWDLAAETILV